MGRGRAKAKQTKVARRLKYQSIDTDFTALQRELGHEDADGHAHASVDGHDSDGEADDVEDELDYGFEDDDEDDDDR